MLQNCFFFRDAETDQTIAIAVWGMIPTATSCFSIFNSYLQGWPVTIVDRAYFKEKGIPVLYLVGALMKRLRHFKHL